MINYSYFSNTKIVQEYLKLFILDAAAKYSRGNLLDLGCGSKPYEDIFAPYVDSYFGVEHKEINELYFNETNRADLLADCTNTGLKSEAYDTLISTEVLEHVLETELFLKESFRLLKKGGIGIFTVPFIWQLHGEPIDYFRFTPYSLEKLFVNAGFSIIEIKPLQGAFATLIQAKIISIYCRPIDNILLRIIRRIRNIIYFPILNFMAIKFDKFFWNKKMCITYAVIVNK